jgi:hypothetical protein
MFDSIYTGTETRNSHSTHQNLQGYLSYFLPRLLERIKPGLNGGGWFDLFECGLEDYVRQAYLTLFAKCRENMLFCFPLMVRFPAVYMAAAGAVYDDADLFIGEMGEPVGVACYKPHHSQDERHLYDYIGMLGIPLDPYPDYPSEAKTVLLKAAAAKDDDITDKIKKSLLNGSKVFITSGLYEKLAERGIKDILPMEVTGRKITSDTFSNPGFARNTIGHVKAEDAITMSHITYSTNDFWVIATARTPYGNHPLLLQGSYGDGWLYVLNVPDAYADLYKLPAETLTLLRREMDVPVMLECGANVGLFLYDNDTFIIQSFLGYTENVRICLANKNASLIPLTGAMVTKTRSVEDESVFNVTLMQGRYAAFIIDRSGDGSIAPFVRYV